MAPVSDCVELMIDSRLWIDLVENAVSAGALHTVFGAVLILAGAYLTQPTLLRLEAATMVGGLIQMISPQTQTAPENTSRYVFGSAKNTTASGNPVPLCIGERRWSGAIISCGIYAEDQV